jgi:hypothetical protein
MPETILEKRRMGRKLKAAALTEVGASLMESDWRLLHDTGSYDRLHILKVPVAIKKH